jgi:MarR family transcriptional regulator, transcriptional regulator for hemolysin
MLTYEFEESIGYWVVMAFQALERALGEELARHGITVRQWQVLAWLVLEGDLSQSELADRMGIEAPTLVGILDRMERDGWITRCECPDDRRRKLVRPTERVQPVWSKMVACARRVRARATQGIDPELVRQTREVLATIKANLTTSAVEERVR